MAFLKVDHAAVIASGTSNYIKTSGIYTVKLNHVEIAPTSGGATQANYLCDNIMAYGQIVANKEGKTTDKNGKKLSGYGAIEALAVILGTEDENGNPGFADPESTSVKFSKATKDLMCLPGIDGDEVKVWVQFEYQKYKGEIKERINVKRFYRESDGASGSEISLAAKAAEDGTIVPADKAAGTQLAKDEVYASEVKYTDSSKGAGDAPTETEVAAWKKAQAGGNAATASTASAPAKPKNNPFAK